MNSLGYFDVGPKLKEAFPGEVKTSDVTFIIAGEDREFRVAINSVENKAQMNLGDEILGLRASVLSQEQNKFLLEQQKAKRRIMVNPSYAAMIDVDVFQEHPLSIDARDFITTSIGQVEKGLQHTIK